MKRRSFLELLGALPFAARLKAQPRLDEPTPDPGWTYLDTAEDVLAAVPAAGVRLEVDGRDVGAIIEIQPPKESRDWIEWDDDGEKRHYVPGLRRYEPINLRIEGVCPALRDACLDGRKVACRITVGDGSVWMFLGYIVHLERTWAYEANPHTLISLRIDGPVTTT